MWDASLLLSDPGNLGRALHTLIGHVDQPTATRLVVCTATLAMIVTLMRAFAAPAARQPRTA